MKIIKRYYILVLIAALTIYGCVDEATCIPEYTDLIHLSFVDEAGKAKGITVVSLEAVGSNENFPIIQDSTFSTISIPLNPLDSIMKLNFVQTSATHTIWLNYKAIPRLTDPKCGLETYFKDIAVDSTNFIKVQVINPELNKEITSNVKITH